MTLCLDDDATTLWFDFVCTWDHQTAKHLEAVQGLLLHQRPAALLAAQSAQQLVAPACLEVPHCS